MRAEILLLISIGNVELDELYSFAGAKHPDVQVLAPEADGNFTKFRLEDRH